MFYKQKKDQNIVYNRRTFFLLLSKLGIFSIIGWRFFNIQILDSKKYKTLSKKNQINVEILPPVRGKIKDRNGISIVTNKKVYDLYIIPEKTNNLEQTLNKLNDYVKISYRDKRNVINLAQKLKKFSNIKVIENLDWSKLELIEANKNYLPGIYLQEDYQRIYIFNNQFSHILGYISQPSLDDFNLPLISKMPKLYIGKTGLEKRFNDVLIGKAGKREIEVNSSGRIIREISRTKSQNGVDLNITIDHRLQKFCFDKLSQHKAGSIVLLDISTGEIISMVSTPSFDPNLIIKKPNQEYWNSIINNAISPLTDRSIQGLYAPGSTFKMIVALAGLRYNLINPNQTVFCEGKIEFGDRPYHCWKTKGHGTINLEKAIKESCDVYFYELSKKIGIDKISQMAKEFGLGQKYEIGFDNEKEGIIPTKKWKKKKYKEGWYAGETLNAGIGQGYTLTTPLQLAVMTARIASEGKKIVPTIIKSNDDKKFDTIKNISDHITLIKKAMFKVVNEYGGTAYRSMSSEYSFSGKTGTSQVKRITLSEREEEDFRKKEIEWKNKDHALFVGYLPAVNPKYALSVIIEHGGSGASIAAPIAKDIFDYINNEII